MAKFIIADSQTLLREGLSSILNGIEDWEVVAQAADGFELISLVERHLPDLLILDPTLSQFGGVGSLARLKRLQTAPSILVLSDKNSKLSIKEALNAGAQGCLSKSAHSNELEFAIRSILDGLVYVSPSMATDLIESHNKSDSELSCLTSREKEVMKLLAEGLPNREVAKLLHISPRTIDSHRANIMKKLGANSNSELVRISLKNGLIKSS